MMYIQWEQVIKAIHLKLVKREMIMEPASNPQACIVLHLNEQIIQCHIEKVCVKKVNYHKKGMGKYSDF